MPANFALSRSPQAPSAADLASALAAYEAQAHHARLCTPRYHMSYTDWAPEPTRQATPHPADAPPIVFIHGLADQRRSFAMVMHYLTQLGRRCIAYELADGYEDHAKLRNYRHEHFTEDLLCLLDHLKLKQVDLVGCSFGSTIALRAMKNQPARFRKVVLQGGFAYRPMNGIELVLTLLGRLLPGRMSDLPKRREVSEKLDRPQLPGCPDAILSFLQDCGGRTPCRAAAHRGNLIRTLDLRPWLPCISQPVCLLGGDADPIVPRYAEALLEQSLPNVRRVEIAPGGHFPQYATPRTMAEVIAEFCTSDD